MKVPTFDPVIHAPGRLQICAVLVSVEEAEFSMLRDALAVSDSVLSKHLKLLNEAQYIAIRKAVSSGRNRTWARLTPLGRRAFTAHLAELQRLASLQSFPRSEEQSD
ncbi:MarR family transcriptional regulator [Brevundimonas sp. AAP58]|uniref:winged helix-turn-helix domain-containing protein n=1 Tax=Brevundimonas sp. AAP58 TaxID=1523422 RepID=UPI0006B9C156|nr:transcriptional regulator [Brevundimonas sp. AAP58]KPF78889.1 MarR family transcriptional regulator [Brevundimonas sp. AAP58]